MFFHKFRKFLLFYTMLSVACGLFVSPVDAAQARTRKLPQRSRDAYPKTRYDSKRRKVSAKKSIKSLNSYRNVQVFLQNRDYAGLKNAVRSGLSLEGENTLGDTPVCTAVKSGDYVSFSMLKSAGANLSPRCMKEIPVEQRQAFIQRYMEIGGTMSLAAQEGMMSESSGLDALLADNSTLLIGGSIVGGALIAGAVAAGGGGGGSSGGGGGGDVPVPVGFDPIVYPSDPEPIPTGDVTNPNYYNTKEFRGEGFKNKDGEEVSVQNFLGQIGAQNAYAIAAANSSMQVAGLGVTIAVIDQGVDSKHTDLDGNIFKGRTFNYGPCGEGDSTNCWTYDGSTVAFYDENANIIASRGDAGGLDFFWDRYKSLFPSGWDWDTGKDNPDPLVKTDNPDLFLSADMHGTHVAGIAAGEKNGSAMHGVAYNAKIIGINVGDMFGIDPLTLEGHWVTLPEVTKRIHYESFKYAVDNGARVLNNSWGPSTTISDDFEQNAELFRKGYGTLTETSVNLAKGIMYAADNKSVTVFSAGNKGLDQPNLTAAAPFAMPSLLYYKSGDELLPMTNLNPTNISNVVSSLLVSVVSLNSSGTKASYSQSCGAAARWCISAPGGDIDADGLGIVSTIPNNGYEVAQGTSMATPVVTGALATILASLPPETATGERAVEIMFRTATDIGVAGVDSVYGWGALNLGAALNSVGTTSLALSDTSTGDSVAYAGTRFTVPKAFSKSLLDNLPEQVMVLDEYKRGYSIPTSTMIKTTTHSKQAFADNLRSFTMYQKPQTTKLTDTVDMNFSENAKAFSNDAMNGVNLSFNYHKDNITADFSFTQNAKEGTKSYFDQSLRNPFTTSATDVYAFQNGYNLTKELKVGFGASVGKNNFFDGNERVDYRHDKSIKTGELNFDYQPVSYAKVNFTGGILEENGSLLGLNGLGGLKTQDGQTYFMGSQLTVEPTKKVRLSAAYYYGTGGFKKQENALMHLSKVQSESMAFKAEYQFDEDMLFGARAFSPLHIKKAKATFDLPVGRSYTETTVYRERVTANLRPEAKEWDFGVFSVYNMDAWTFQAEALTRLNPENQADMKPDYRLMFSVGFGY